MMAFCLRKPCWAQWGLICALLTGVPAWAMETAADNDTPGLAPHGTSHDTSHGTSHDMPHTTPRDRTDHRRHAGLNPTDGHEDMLPDTIAMFDMDHLETRDSHEGQPMVWSFDSWIGNDDHKVWVKSAGERLNGETESAEWQLLWHKPVAPYWNLQTGWRRDFQPDAAQRDWLALTLAGTAPYFIETEASVFIGEDSRMAVRLELEYELLITQRLELIVFTELDAASKADDKNQLGQGLVSSETGARLQYAIRREFAPYIGVVKEQVHGQTAQWARQQGDDVKDYMLTGGIRFWF